MAPRSSRLRPARRWPRPTEPARPCSPRLSTWMPCGATGRPGEYSATGGPNCTIPSCRSMAAAEARDAAVFNLPRDLVFVDLETTGGNAAFHRITEVGIVRMVDDRVVEEWSSLVNPECRIPA